MEHSSPATKADIERIMFAIQNLYKADDQILTVLVHVDKRLTAIVENHERRLVAFERK